MPVPGEFLNDYDAGDKEWEAAAAKHDLQEEYGDDLNKFEADLKAKEEADRLQALGGKALETLSPAEEAAKKEKADDDSEDKTDE